MSRSCLLLAALTALLIPSTGGCYQYVTSESSSGPEPAPAPQPGEAVRVHLERPLSFEVSGFTAHDIVRVDGSLLERDRDDWVVATRTLHASAGDRFEAGSFALSIAPEAVRAVEVRAFSRWRTVAAGLLGAAVIYLASEMLQGTSSTGDATPPGEGGRSIIPLP